MLKPGYARKRIWPVWPIYAAGVVFLIYSAIGRVYEGSQFFVACLLALATWVIGTFAVTKSEVVEVNLKTGNNDADSVIESGRKSTARLRAMLSGIKDYDLKSYVSRTERALTAMVDAVAQTPSKGSSIKKFINYYVPTITKLLDAYDRMSDVEKTTGIAPEGGVSDMLSSIKESMKTVASATEKQLQSMYNDEKLDISTDIEVLESMMAADGLVGSDPFKQTPGKTTIQQTFTRPVQQNVTAPTGTDRISQPQVQPRVQQQYVAPTVQSYTTQPQTQPAQSGQDDGNQIKLTLDGK